MNTRALTNRLRAFGDIDHDETVVGFGMYHLQTDCTLYAIREAEGNEYLLTRHEDYDGVLARLEDYE